VQKQIQENIVEINVSDAGSVKCDYDVKTMNLTPRGILNPKGSRFLI